MAEWLGNGLQNHVQQFDSAWHLYFMTPRVTKRIFGHP